MTGDDFRKKREDLGLRIDEISDLLKIKPDYLKWIESDSFEKLPAPVYTMGYIRCYARHLEIDADPIIQYYTEHLSQPKATTIMPVGFSRKRSPLLIYVFLILIIASVVFFIRLNMPGKQTDIVQAPAYKVSTQPSVAAKPSSAIQPSVVTKPSSAIQPSVVTKPSSTAQPSTVTQPSIATQYTAGKSLPSREKKENSLDMIASERTWLMIKFSNGKTEELTLQPGGSKNWKFQDQAVIKIGNAGGIKLNLNGKDIGSPGSKGQVITLSVPDN